jgi:hypothetical protein
VDSAEALPRRGGAATLIFEPIVSRPHLALSSPLPREEPHALPLDVNAPRHFDRDEALLLDHTPTAGALERSGEDELREICEQRD